MELTTETIAEGARALEDRLRSHRRTIHRHPELAFEEHRTAAYVEEVLDDLGVPHRRVVGTGVVAVLAGRGSRCVAVRADMDALPIEEAPGREGYRSEIPGVSHACGHDGHVAVGLGLAELLSDVHDLPGTVALYFQPAEEGPGGAAPMVEAGVLEDPAPSAILALHVAASQPSGVVAVRPGAVNAANDTVEITVEGRGGHAAHPDEAVDAIAVAAQIVTAVQHIVSREIDPVRPAVVTFGEIHGGDRENVVASRVRLRGTVRTLQSEVRTHIRKRLTEIADGVARAHRASATVDVEPGYPAGYNDPALVDLVAESAREVLGGARVVTPDEPSLGSEDFFAFGATGLPVCMFRLGVADPGAGIGAPHHSPGFDLDESALPAGVAVLGEAVRRLLRPGGPGAGTHPE